MPKRTKTKSPTRAVPSDLFDKRRRMMAEWAEFLAREELPAQVVDLAAVRDQK